MALPVGKISISQTHVTVKRCPICRGRGTVEAGFYPEVDVSEGRQKCRSCKDGVIILESLTTTEQPVPEPIPVPEPTYIPPYKPIVAPSNPWNPVPWTPRYPPYRQIWWATQNNQTNASEQHCVH